MCFLMIVYLLCWHINHNFVQKLWLCDRLCHKYLMPHIQGGKNGDIITFANFEEGDLYQKLITIRKMVINMMTTQLLQHYLVKKKWMICHHAMSMRLKLCLQRCQKKSVAKPILSEHKTDRGTLQDTQLEKERSSGVEKSVFSNMKYG